MNWHKPFSTVRKVQFTFSLFQNTKSTGYIHWPKIEIELTEEQYSLFNKGTSIPELIHVFYVEYFYKEIFYVEYFYKEIF